MFFYHRAKFQVSSITVAGFNQDYGMQKQTSRGILRKRCSENMQQIYRRTTMPKCDFMMDFSEFGMGVFM